MTKKLTAAQKAANKKARAQRQSDAGPPELTKLINSGFKTPPKSRAAKMPTKTAKQRAQKAVVELHDAGGTITHDAAAMQAAEDARVNAARPISGPAARVQAQLKLDKAKREAPLKGVRGRVAPKPAPADKPARTKRATAAAATSTTASTRELKYADAGEGHPHRFSGRNWDGVMYRSANGTLGLERSTDEGATWTRYLSDAEFVHRDRWDLGRAIQRSTKEKSHDIKGRRVAGAAAASKPARSKKAAGADAIAPVVDTEAWKKAPPVVTCQWGEVFTVCKKTSAHRVVCSSGAKFLDLCSSHEALAMTTKADAWQGCKSYPLTPNGVKVAASAVVSA